eukprot:TRINITY_DN10322_c0_g1_i3.p1 TRINITY_DN10322_c0_g1~~TRINITY_DN10322_c0_g1_i3.p1  ORF type:complete len:1515 (+),score=435.77 TRINITY_DN10322_c0_g1_i3:2-4546(+)
MDRVKIDSKNNQLAIEDIMMMEKMLEQGEICQASEFARKEEFNSWGLKMRETLRRNRKEAEKSRKEGKFVGEVTVKFESFEPMEGTKLGRYLCSGRIGKSKKTDEITMPTDDVEFKWSGNQVLSWRVTDPLSPLLITVHRNKKGKEIGKLECSLLPWSGVSWFWGNETMNSLCLNVVHPKKTGVVVGKLHLSVTYTFSDSSLAKTTADMGSYTPWAKYHDILSRILSRSVEHFYGEKLRNKVAPSHSSESLFPEDWNALLDDFYLRFLIPEATSASVKLEQVYMNPRICLLHQHEFESAIQLSRELCVQEVRAVTKEQVDVCSKTIDVLEEVVSQFLSDFKWTIGFDGASVEIIRNLIHMFSLLKWIENDEKKQSLLLHDIVETAMEKYVSHLSRLYQIDGLGMGPKGETQIVRCIRMTMDVQQSIMADIYDLCYVFPSSIGYLEFAPQKTYECFVNAVTPLIQRIDKKSFDSNIFELGREMFHIHDIFEKQGITLTHAIDINHAMNLHFKTWLDLTKENLQKWMVNAINLDNWEPIDGELHTSSSSRGVATACNTAFSLIRKMRDSSGDSNEKVLDMIGTIFVEYGEAMRDMIINRDLSNLNLHATEPMGSEREIVDGAADPPTPKTDSRSSFSPETFVRLNNIQRMASHFEEMFLTVQERDIVLSDTSKESPLEKVHRIQQKNMRHVMDESCTALVKKFFAPIREMLVQVLDKPDSEAVVDVEKRLDKLVQFLDTELGILSESLDPTVFRMTVKKTFTTCMDAIEHFVTKETHDTALSTRRIAILKKVVSILSQYFDDGGGTVPRSLISSQSSFVSKTLEYAQLPTDSLIAQYWKLKKSDQNDPHLPKIMKILSRRSDEGARVFTMKYKTTARTRMMRATFNLPDTEELFGLYHCEENSGEEGHLYITSNHLGFATKEDDAQRKKLVHLLDVTSASAVRLDDEKEARCVEVTLGDDSGFIYSGFKKDAEEICRDIAIACKRIGNDITSLDRPKTEKELRKEASLLKKHNIPSNQKLLRGYSCTNRMAISGTMYIFSSMVMFKGRALDAWDKLFSLDQIISMKKNRVFGIDFKLKNDSLFRTAALIHRDTAFKMIHQQSIESGLSWMGQMDKHLFVPGMVAESLDLDEIDRENMESSALFSPITPPEDLRFAFDLEYDETLHSSYQCTKEGEAGHLYVFSKHVCFDSLLFSMGIFKLSLPMNHLKSLKPFRENGRKALQLKMDNDTSYTFVLDASRRECARKIEVLAKDCGTLFKHDDKRWEKDRELISGWGLKAVEEIVSNYNCFSSHLWKGKLYILRTVIVFQPFLRKKEKAVIIRLRDVTEVKGVRFLPSLLGGGRSIRIVTADLEKYYFLGFVNRQNVLDDIKCQLKELDVDLDFDSKSERKVKERIRKRNEEIRELFSLSELEEVIDEFPCQCGLIRGRLVLMKSHLGFEPSLFGKKNAFCLSVGDITSIEKQRALIVMRGLRIVDKFGQIHTFTSVSRREEAHDAITDRVSDFKRRVVAPPSPVTPS